MEGYWKGSREIKKSTKKWLVGSGVVTAGAAAVRAAAPAVSKYLAKLAMDRNGPKKVEKGVSKASGSAENAPLVEANMQAMQLLEEKVTETSQCGKKKILLWHLGLNNSQPDRVTCFCGLPCPEYNKEK